MGPRSLLTTILLLAQAKPLKASQYCGHLDYWNPDKRCCGSCLQRFGPPPCQDFEFVTNCGLDDSGNHLTHPFKECPAGWCNRDGAELCRPCGGRAPTLKRRSPGTEKRCAKRQVPTKKPCPRPYTPSSNLSSQAPSSPATSRLSGTSERQHTTADSVSPQTLRGFSLQVVVVVVVLLVTSSLIFLLAVHRCHCKRKGSPVPSPSWACDSRDSLFLLHSAAPGSLKAPKVQAQLVSLHPLQGTALQTLETQPLSLLLDELEVLEELIVLLDPETGPGGSMACGTTRHLAARYGLPAAWSTFAYSLRPSRSPLRALLEMVVAREPSACLGQLAAHLVQMGRTDALQVLAKLS